MSYDREVVNKRIEKELSYIGSKVAVAIRVTEQIKDLAMILDKMLIDTGLEIEDLYVRLEDIQHSD